VTLKLLASRAADTVIMIVVLAAVAMLTFGVWKFMRENHKPAATITCPYCGKQIPINVGKENNK